MSRTIKSLHRKARGGDVNAKMQLAKFYLEGTFVNKDSEESSKLIKEVAQITTGAALKVSSIRLQNFRRFEDVSLSLNPDITVLVADNGFGKTTFLESIATSLTWLVSNIIKENRPGSYIANGSIKSGQDIASTTMTLDFCDHKYSIVLSKAKEASPKKQENELSEVKLLSDIYRFTNDYKFRNLPFLGFYTVDRAVAVKRRDFNKADKHVDSANWDRMSAYKNCLDNPSDFSDFMSWLIRQDSIEKENTKDNESIASQILGLNEALSVLNEVQEKDEAVSEAIDNLLSRIRELESKSASSTVNRKGVLSRVYDAISLFMPDLMNLRISYKSDNPADLLMEKKGITISAQQLSQGEKSILALVGDIAKRMIILNPHLDNPLEADGVVLIDEIDLHLHPSWQQQVISNLRSLLPNIQLVISTHSPHVLSNLQHEAVKVIGGASGVESISSPSFTYGAEAQKILEDVFKVPSRPEGLDIIKKLDAYKELVRTDRWSSEEAVRLKEELLLWAGDHDSVMARLDMDVRMRKRRKGKQ